jgi:hypothetical protein
VPWAGAGQDGVDTHRRAACVGRTERARRPTAAASDLPPK